VSVAAPGNGTRYLPQSFAFVADSLATTLTFRDTSLVTANVDLMLDNVRVTPQSTGAPTITSQPQSLTVTVGSSATFSVTATGTAPLTYQWRFNGTPISGATASSYTIASAQASQAGTYSVVVSNIAGSTTSAGATLTVQSTPVAPTITSQPQSLTVTVGSSATFSVTATGTAPLSYQWRFNGTPISGATASSYTIASAQASQAGTYDVVVTNTAGSTPSTGATLTVITGSGLTNGSFESDYTAWTASGNQQVVVAGSFGFAVTDGTKAVAFNAGDRTPNGVLSQTFATTVGQGYTLTFDVGAFSLVTQDTQRMQVTVQGSATLVSQSVSVAAPGNGTQYLPQSFAFVADSLATTLTFRDTSLVTANVDLMLDNVRVTSTP
jgi:hypothetical protein